MRRRKYELVKRDFILHEGKKLYRIKALRNLDVFSGVSRGDIGGYVEGYHNLSQEDNCWVFHNAKVYGNARVIDDALVGGEAEVFGNAVVKEDSAVGDDAKVYDNASICGTSRVTSGASVFGNAAVTDNSDLYGCNCSLMIYGNALLKGSSDIIRYIENSSKDQRACCLISDNVLVKNSLIKIGSDELLDLSGNSVIQEYTELKE